MTERQPAKKASKLTSPYRRSYRRSYGHKPRKDHLEPTEARKHPVCRCGVRPKSHAQGLWHQRNPRRWGLTTVG